MDVTIFYCRTCHFEPPARAIAAALEKECGVRCELRPAFWGTFRIVHAGEEIFNRWKTRGWLGRLGCGRTPTSDEIVALVRERLAAKSSEAGVCAGESAGSA